MCSSTSSSGNSSMYCPTTTGKTSGPIVPGHVHRKTYDERNDREKIVQVSYVDTTKWGGSRGR